MDFGQMLEAWRAQDDKPLYGVNRDLLQLVLRHEQANIRRQLRHEQWITYGVGAGMVAVGGYALWALVYYNAPLRFALAAAARTAVVLLWMAALWLSLRRQRRRERQLGSMLREEIMRNLSLVDYQLSRWGRFSFGP